MKLNNLTEAEGLVGGCYFPLLQNMPRGLNPTFGLTFAIRTAGEPLAQANAFRRVIGGIDRQIAVYDLQTMTARSERAKAVQRSPMLLSLGFGAIALILSAIGIYGVLAYLVAQRRKEIGIRIALGSSRARIYRLVLREGLTLVSIGLGIGAAGALAIRRSLDALLFGVTATDLRVLTGAAVLLAVVALAACLFPARRAAAIDAIVALAE
jgi:putative ABC transport system permease protein